MATIETRTAKDGTVSYRVKVRLRGYPVQSATFSRKTDARRWTQDTEASIRDGRHFKTAEAKKHTIAELIARYIKEILPLKPKSASDQTIQLNWWKDQIGTFLLSELTPALISEYRNKLASEAIRVDERKVSDKVVKTEIKRSAATLNRYMAAFSHALTIAVKEWGWLEDNPMRKVSKLREPRGRVRFLSDNERQKLLTACTESPNSYLYLITILALSTGARKMELLGLSWDDVDFTRKIITLHETKNGERRLLPLAGLACELLAEHSKVQQPNTNLVFPSKDGKKPMDIRTPWETVLKRAGIKDFHFHDLRHSAASYLAMNGASLAEIAEVLGHKTLQMVKRYAHLSDAHTADVVTRMNSKIFG